MAGSRGWWRLGLLTAILAILVSAFFVLTAVVDLAAGAKAALPLAADAAMLAVALALFAVCVHWAVRANRRLRTLAESARANGAALSLPRRLLPLVVWIVSLGLMVSVAVSFHAAGAYSASVQHEGVPDSGTVERVNNTRPPKGTWTAEITVLLDHPVGQTTTTIVHFPAKSPLTAGQKVTVRVDPRDPTYAEFPGRPATGEGDWGLFAVFAGIIAVVFGPIAWLVFASTRPDPPTRNCA